MVEQAAHPQAGHRTDHGRSHGGQDDAGSVGRGRIDCGHTVEFVMRPLTGWDEYELGRDRRVGHRLLSRLMSTPSNEPLGVDELPVSLVDRLLAEFHIAHYGRQVDCQATCTACNERYEFTLDLRDLMAGQDREHPGPPDADGAWTLHDGRRVRAPRWCDTGSVDSGDLGSIVMVEGDYGDDPEAVEAFLDRAAPLLTIDLNPSCPSCSAAQRVRFDLADYLAARLEDDRTFLLREVHLLGSAYHWSRSEILDLSQEERRFLVKLVEGDRLAAVRVRP